MSGFRDLMAAEWIKMRAMRSTRWGYLLAFLGVLWMDVNAALADYDLWKVGNRYHGNDLQHDVFTNNAHMVVLMIFGALGAVVMVGEYGTGMVRATFAAVPDRRAVVAAKVVVLTIVSTVMGVLVVAASYLSVEAIDSSRYGWLDPTTHQAVRYLLASVLLAPVSALVGLGLGALVRHSAPSMISVILLLAFVPNVLVSRIHAWINDLHNMLPFSAWQRLSEDDVMRNQPGAFAWPTIGGSWLVYAVWAVAGVLLAWVAVERRDV